jgi:exopolyphosphatase/guanosine-5'-triphosphate,3'-diphosphate pyrophosphatase
MTGPAGLAGPGETVPSKPPVAVIDVGASAVRIVIAEIAVGRPPVILEEASRGVPLGKDSFSAGRIGPSTLEAALRALDGFRRMMDAYGVADYRAVATSAVREAGNAEMFLDRVQVRTGIRIDVIDGTEESRLTYLAVRERLKSHPALAGPHALLVEVGGGSADLTFLEDDRPKHSGVYPLGSIRMRQSLAAWHGAHEQRIRLLTRHIANVVGDIEGEIPLAAAQHMIALGSDVRFVASQILETREDGVHEVSREAFIAFCATVERLDEEALLERYHLSQVDAETLVPALLVYRSLLLATAAATVTVPDVSLRFGLLVDMARPGGQPELEDFSRQVLASAEALGERYRFDAPHARHVAQLAAQLFDDLLDEHGLKPRDRLLLEVAALLHDIGTFVNLRAHHKHSQYMLGATEIFGLSGDDMMLVSNIARYHRRGLPQKSHLPYMSLDREERVRVNKLAALLRVANALDAEHMQKVNRLRVRRDGATWTLEVNGSGDLTMERLATTSRADLFAQVFGHELVFRGSGALA